LICKSIGRVSPHSRPTSSWTILIIMMVKNFFSRKIQLDSC
jgi:hypothetical protein